MSFQNYKIMKVIPFEQIYVDNTLLSVKLMHAGLNAKIYIKWQRKNVVIHIWSFHIAFVLCVSSEFIIKYILSKSTQRAAKG